MANNWNNDGAQVWGRLFAIGKSDPGTGVDSLLLSLVCGRTVEITGRDEGS